MNKCIPFLAVAALALGGSAFAQSAWLPTQGTLLVTPGYTYQTFDDFWMGKNDATLPDDLTQHTGYLNFEYGILPDLTADLTVGYAHSELEPAGSDDGLTDTYFGLRYRLVDEAAQESAWVPTVTVRVGGIIAGSYDENFPFSVGDGAHGADFTLMLGKMFGESGFGLYGDFGYRVRESPVPDEVFGRIGALQSLGPVTLSVGYRHVQSTSGLNIGVAPFNPAAAATGFPALKEIQQLIEGGIAYTDGGGRSYQFLIAHALDGRNTGDKLVVGFAITIPLSLR